MTLTVSTTDERTTTMRKYLFVIALLPSLLMAQVRLTIIDGISNNSVKQAIEKNTSALLTDINDAQAAGRTPNFGSLNLPQSVQISLSMLWENSPFMVTETDIQERCLQTATGYQVRNISLQMLPREAQNFNEEEYQEAVISYDKQGRIESFYLSLNMNLYKQVMNSNRGVEDLRRRQLILDWTERFRTSYNTKDIQFLDQVFSEDALIITGKVIRQTKSDVQLPEKIEYTKQTKNEYLTKLRRVFKNNSYIKVTFDDVQISGHPVNPDIYGVTVHQGYTSSNYHDDGYLFLLWDFKNEDEPKIHVRTWQPIC